jgi:molecular chaperone GrpE
VSDSGFTEAPAPDQEARRSDLRVVDKRWWVRGEHAGAEDRPSSKPTYVEELERRLADQQGQTQTYAAKYRDAAQDFELARVRLRREVSREVERDKRTILADLLEILDNVDRAIEAARTGAPGGALLQGVELVRSQFLAKLRSHGVSPIVSLGQPFDPALHDAVSTVTISDPAQDNTVVGIIREGYRIGDDVLRPATVAVGRTVSQPQNA